MKMYRVVEVQLHAPAATTQTIKPIVQYFTCAVQLITITTLPAVMEPEARRFGPVHSTIMSKTCDSQL
jgi:hypothetical protein